MYHIIKAECRAAGRKTGHGKASRTRKSGAHKLGSKACKVAHRGKKKKK